MSYSNDDDTQSRKRRSSMPVATSTEEAVLGFVLRAESVTQTWQHFESASGMDDDSGPSELFFTPAHNAVASIMEDISSRGEKITENLIADRLSARGFTELGSDDLSPDEYLSWLTVSSTSISTVSAMEDAISVLREHNARRNGITFAEELLDNLRDTDVEMDKIHAMLEDGASDALVASTRHIPGFSDVYEEEMYGEHPSYSVPSGIPSIDASLSGTTVGEDTVRGFGAGRTYVLAAGPGVGKTTMMFRFVREAVDSGATALVISAESSGADIMSKILSGESGAKFSQILQTVESQDDTFSAVDEEFRDGVLAAVEKYHDVGGRSKIKIIQQAQPVSMIPSNVMSIRAENPDNEKIIVFIDYLQLLVEDSRNEREEIANMTKELHRIAQNMRVPIVMLSQFTKIEKGARPSITQLYGSSSIEKDSDGIMLAWRPADMDNPEESGDKYANMGFGDSDLLVDMSKNRINERSGDNIIRLIADYSRCIIEENDESIQDFGGDREYSRRERNSDDEEHSSDSTSRSSTGDRRERVERRSKNQSMGSAQASSPKIPQRRSRSRGRRRDDSAGGLDNILD